MRRSKAFTLIELLVVIAIIALLISILMPSLARTRELSRRSVCSANLRGIGQSFYIYAQDPPGAFPQIAGVDQNDTGVIRCFFPQDRLTTPSTTGTPSPTVDMWTVIRSRNSVPKQFNCPSTRDLPDPAQDVAAYFDFLTAKNLSYAYVQQHDPDRPAIGADSEPTFPVMADGNPYIKGGVGQTMTLLLDRQSRFRGNSRNHTTTSRAGQNVLIQDGHVDFAKSPAYGLAGHADPNINDARGLDNIYSYVNAEESNVDPGDVKPTADKANPGSRSDCVLVP